MGYEVIEETTVALEVLSQPEEGGKYLAGGVINGKEEDEPRATSFQPIVVAAIDLDQKAHLGFSGTTAVELGRSVLLRAWDTSGLEDASDRGRAQGNAFVLVEQLAEKGIVTPPVFGLSELDHLLADTLWDSMGRLTTPIPMGQGGRSVSRNLALSL